MYSRTLGLLSLIVALMPAEAATINTLFNTGVDANGVPIPSGPDPQYSIVAVAQAFADVNNIPPFPPIVPLSRIYSVTLPRTPVVVEQPFPGAWVPNGPTSNWIGPFSIGEPFIDGAGLDDNGNYIDQEIWVYQTTFDLSGLNPASVQISGVWGTDDPGWMYLNLAGPLDVTHLVATTAVPGLPSVSELRPFSISGSNGLFEPGLNT